MGVLTREEILKEINRGTIEIDPFEEDQIGPGSIDLRLGNEFRVLRN
jgi:dCTP deaminase